MQETISKEEQERKKIAKEKIAKLVQEFQDKVISSGKRESYTEADVKHHFLDKLFRALGWGTHDIRYEEGRMDYLFRLENKKVMVIEAKKPSVLLKERTASGNKVAKQAVNYAYNSNIEVCAVADFEELVVYHGLRKPRDITKNLILLTKTREFSLRYENYIENFEELWLLSKDSFRENRLDQFLNIERKKHKTVDEELLEDFLKFRRVLSKDIKKNNQGFSSEEIDWAVQKILGRLMFIRSTEDRGLEERDLLLNKVKNFEDNRTSERLWPTIIKVFHKFNKTYNSELFQNDLIDYGLKLSDNIISKIIKGLYFGTSGGNERYEFDLIPADLLGQIYEQYLGELLRETEKRVKLEKSKTKRKSMGIYYTPKYIVDYIVENTVGEYCKGKSLKELTGIKIVDPACGSGSFLQVAFERMQEEYIDRIQKGKKFGIFDSLEKDKSGNPKLTLGQKNHILINNIFGVDLDDKAVEIAKLSLVLKMLEGESSATKKRRIETIKENIQCGNSLIDDPKIAGDKSFKWKSRFPEIFRKGGFDIVIGNPPYIDIKGLSKKDVRFFFKRYVFTKNRMNIYSIFVDKGTQLLSPQGKLGYIIPNSILFNQSYKPIRNYLLTKTHLRNIVKLPDDVFGDAKVETIILILSKNISNNPTKIILCSPKKRITTINGTKNLLNRLQNDWLQNDDQVINIFSNKLKDDILKKIERDSTKLIDIADFSLGLTPYDKYRGHSKEQIENKVFHSKTKIDSSYKKLLLGKDITRYHIQNPKDSWIRYGNWLGAPRESRFFIEPRIVIRQIISGSTPRIYAAYSNKEYYNAQIAFNIILKKSNNTLYVLGLINSKLLNFYHREKFLDISKRLFQKILVVNAKRLPIKITNQFQKKLTILVERIIELNNKLNTEMIEHKKRQIQRQIQDTEYEIDQLVYKLYGLTKDEIKIVEDSFK